MFNIIKKYFYSEEIITSQQLELDMRKSFDLIMCDQLIVWYFTKIKPKLFRPKIKRSITKIVLVGFIGSAMSLNTISVFAAEILDNSTSKIIQSYGKNNNLITASNLQSTPLKKIIKLEEAIASAINNSDNLALKSKEIKMYEDKMKLQEKTNDLYKSINQKVYDFPYDRLELQKKQTEQSKNFIEDQIASDITNKYNDMILKEIDLDKSKKTIKIKINELEYMKGKLSLGMATENQLEDTEIEIKTLEDNITAQENTLNNNKDFFKVLTNLDLRNTYMLDYNNLTYEKFKIDGPIDVYIDDKIDNYLKYNTKILKLTKEYMKDLKDDGIKDIMKEELPKIPDKSSAIITKNDGTSEFDSGSYALKLIEYQQKQQEFLSNLNSYGDYLDSNYSYAEAQVKINDSKKNLKNGLKESYSTLLDLENKIDTLKEQVISTNTKLSFAKAQVDMGLMLENDYNQQVLESQDLDTSLRKLVYTHNNLKDSIEKPWILNNQ